MARQSWLKRKHNLYFLFHRHAEEFIPIMGLEGLNYLAQLMSTIPVNDIYVSVTKEGVGKQAFKLSYPLPIQGPKPFS